MITGKKITEALRQALEETIKDARCGRKQYTPRISPR